MYVLLENIVERELFPPFMVGPVQVKSANSVNLFFGLIRSETMKLLYFPLWIIAICTRNVTLIHAEHASRAQKAPSENYFISELCLAYPCLCIHWKQWAHKSAAENTSFNFDLIKRVWVTIFMSFFPHTHTSAEHSTLTIFCALAFIRCRCVVSHAALVIISSFINIVHGIN